MNQKLSTFSPLTRACLAVPHFHWLICNAQPVHEEDAVPADLLAKHWIYGHPQACATHTGLDAWVWENSLRNSDALPTTSSRCNLAAIIPESWIPAVLERSGQWSPILLTNSFRPDSCAFEMFGAPH